MGLPAKSTTAHRSHVLRARIPHGLWNRFLEACESMNEDNASAVVRDLMRDYVRASKGRRVIVGLRRQNRPR